MDTAKLIGGPCRVYVDVSSVDTEVGHLNGGADVNIAEPATFNLMADELGETPVDAVYNGRSGWDTVVIRLAEFTEENLVRAIPNSLLITDATTPSKKRVEVRAVAGTLLSANAKKWTIKAIDPSTGAVSTDKQKWVTIPRGAAISAVNIPYKKGEQRQIEMTLACLPDSANNYRTIFFGDSTATA
jgi:hypothetical protein